MATEMKILLSTKENVLVALTLLLVPLLLVEFYGISQMRAAHPEFATNADMPQFVDFLTAIAYSGVIVAVRYVLTRALKPLGRVLLEPKKRTNEDRVERFTTVLFKFIYFVGITYAGYYTMGHEEWFPKSLGGSGDMTKAYYLFNEAPSAGLKTYFLVQLGYHFHSLVYMVALSPIRNDFIEMLVHHVTTIILIGCAFIANYTPSGATVAFVHDIGDVTGYAIKTIVDTGSTPLTIVMYVVLLVSWAYTRLYVFPTELIYNAVFVLPKLTPDIPLLMLHPVNFMLTMLLGLHIYWYGLFLVMGYNLITKGVKEDIQQHIQDKDSKNAEHIALDEKAKHE
uniref:TLC domain-containing protein n=1 Tax=Globisporangium ultimum (strain ATCC 200006 / CBS 805.95 / DAOM BR144) TaxID=431595 RepID=K3X972_GLOUD